MQSINIGETLKKFREKKGMSPEDVSKYLVEKGLKGATKTIYGWERGHSEPDALTLMTLCDLYEIKDIMAEFGYKKIPTPEREVDTKRELLIDNYEKLNEKGREALVDYSRYQLTINNKDKRKEPIVIAASGQSKEKDETLKEIGKKLSEIF